MAGIEKISKQYNKYSLWLIVAITLLGLLIAQVLVRDSLYDIIIFNACYALVLRTLYIVSWKLVAKNHTKQLANFYLGSSIVRLILTLIVALVGVLVMDKEKSLLVAFLVDLSVYYVAILVFDTIFFCTQERNLKNK